MVQVPLIPSPEAPDPADALAPAEAVASDGAALGEAAAAADADGLGDVRPTAGGASERMNSIQATIAPITRRAMTMTAAASGPRTLATGFGGVGVGWVTSRSLRSRIGPRWVRRGATGGWPW
jgi:hypothetical protein